MVAFDMLSHKVGRHVTKLVLQFVDMMVYARAYDASLKHALTSQKMVAELLDSAEPPKEALEDVRKARVVAQTTHDNQSGQDTGNIDPVAPCDVEPTHEQQITVHFGTPQAP